MTSILLVDDEPTISAELKKTLEISHYRVDLAATVEQAVDAASLHPYDLFLTDINLTSARYKFPNTANGVALVMQLRASGIKRPILVFTALEDEASELAALKAGADEYVHKSISIPRLLARIEANIRRHERDTGVK